MEDRRLVNPLTFSISNVADADDITITPSSDGVINRIVIGSTEVYERSATGPVTLDAGATSNDQKLINGTVKVYCTLGTANTYRFTVSGASGTTLNYDDDDNIFTAYAVQERTDVVDDVTSIAFTDANADILYDTVDQTEEVTLNSGTTYIEVEFGISGGVLYHPETPLADDFKTTTTTRLIRFADENTISVKFRPNNNSNVQITARVVHKPELEAVKTYYYRDAVLDKVSGDDQTGRPNTQLTQSLVVRVENERGTAVSGQVVRFQFEDLANFSFSTPNVNNDRKKGDIPCCCRHDYIRYYCFL